MNTIGQSHEQEFVKAFIKKDKQERCIYLLSHPKRRRDFTLELAHFNWLDERLAHSIPARTAHTANELVVLLRKKGAGKMVWIISEDSSIDGTELPLEDAVNRVWGQCMGTILSIVPGKLGFFRGEEPQSELLLERLQ